MKNRIKSADISKIADQIEKNRFTRSDLKRASLILKRVTKGFLTVKDIQRAIKYLRGKSCETRDGFIKVILDTKYGRR